MGKSKRPIGGICGGCAKKLGATINKGAIVAWTGLCGVCQKNRSLCSTSDYHWPD